MFFVWPELIVRSWLFDSVIAFLCIWNESNSMFFCGHHHQPRLYTSHYSAQAQSQDPSPKLATSHTLLNCFAHLYSFFAMLSFAVKLVINSTHNIGSHRGPNRGLKPRPSAWKAIVQNARPIRLQTQLCTHCLVAYFCQVSHNYACIIYRGTWIRTRERLSKFSVHSNLIVLWSSQFALSP